ncbi:MAG: twin-arginine translocase TatA/TatE family subunit [Candidatus Methanoperedens sp.]|nr:twin-arginine translocase TatA/TatE family subunit [Candidatus Methanoperedens sp.]
MGLIGFPELILILVVAMFFFGPDKIPEIARSLGKAAGEFKKAQTETEREVKRLNEPLNQKDIKIRDMAVEMGIDVNNKNIEQLVEEIRVKIRLRKDVDFKKEV